MTDPHINLRHLRAFVKTYELGTLLKASRAVNITQPALTQGLAGLEDNVNARLFERQSDGMLPTEAAHMFYPRAVAALNNIGSDRVSQAQLQAFIMLATHGSYVEAARQANRAKASLHRAIRDLEASVGQSLLHRRGRAIELTDFGRAISRKFRLAQAELSAGLDELSTLRGVARGRVAIGAMPLCRARILPTATIAFQKEYPESDIVIAEGSHAELLEPLRNGDLDFLIGALRKEPPGPDLIQDPLLTDRPVIVARQGHPLTNQQKRPNAKQLAKYDWCIAPRGVPLREHWQEMFELAQCMPPRVRIECGSVILIRQVLIDTDCLTILSPDQVAVELEAGWLSIVGPAPKNMQRVIGVTHREGWRPTNLQRCFIETLKSVC